MLGPVAPSRFNTERDRVGCYELVHDDCALHHSYLDSSPLNLSLNLNQWFRRLFAFYTSKQKTVANCTNTNMLIPEFLSVTKPSRRHEVKTHSRNTTTASFAHDSASRSSLFTIYCRSYVTVRLPFFCNSIRRKSRTFTSSKYRYFYEWQCNGVCWLQQALTRALLACRPHLSANAEIAITCHSTRPWLAWIVTSCRDSRCSISQ